MLSQYPCCRCALLYSKLLPLKDILLKTVITAMYDQRVQFLRKGASHVGSKPALRAVSDRLRRLKRTLETGTAMLRSAPQSIIRLAARISRHHAKAVSPRSKARAPHHKVTAPRISGLCDLLRIHLDCR